MRVGLSWQKIDIKKVRNSLVSAMGTVTGEGSLGGKSYHGRPHKLSEGASLLFIRQCRGIEQCYFNRGVA